MNQFKPLANLAAAAIIAAFSHLPAAGVANPAPEPCGFTRALRTIQSVELVKRHSSGRTQWMSSESFGSAAISGIFSAAQLMTLEAS